MYFGVGRRVDIMNGAGVGHADGDSVGVPIPSFEGESVRRGIDGA